MKVDILGILNDCRIDAQKLHKISEDIKCLKLSATYSGIKYGLEPKGNGEKISSAQRYLEQMERLSHDYELQKSKLMKERIQAEDVISRLPGKQYALMHYRYIKDLSWNEVNDRIGISKNESYYLHRKSKKFLKTLDFQPEM